MRQRGRGALVHMLGLLQELGRARKEEHARTRWLGFVSAAQKRLASTAAHPFTPPASFLVLVPFFPPKCPSPCNPAMRWVSLVC